MTLFPAQTAQDLKWDLWQGTWHVVGTTLGMWKTRMNPTITYGMLPDGTVLDTVQFGPAGRGTLILGIDQPDPQVPGGFIWRGLSNITRLTSSRWRFVALCAEEGWAVTHFSRTLFTPEGLDVYSRSDKMSDELLQDILQQVSGHPLCASLVGQVFRPRR